MRRNIHIIILGIATILLLIIGVSLYFDVFHPFFPERIVSEKYEERNITWDTDFQDSVPYKKGDTIERVWIIKNDAEVAKRITIDPDRIASQIRIQKTTFDKPGIADYTITIDPQSATVVNIQGIALVSSDQSGQPIDIVSDIRDIATSEEPINSGTISPLTKDGSGSDSLFVIGNIAPDTMYNDIDNALSVKVSDTTRVRSVIIGDQSFPALSYSGRILVNIGKNTLANGEYFVALLLKNGTLVASDDTLRIESPSGPITVTDITPNHIMNDSARYIIVRGRGLKSIVSVQLSNNVILKQTDFTSVSDEVMGVKIPEGLTPGTYHLSIMDTGNIYEFSKTIFTVQAH